MPKKPIRHILVIGHGRATGVRDDAHDTASGKTRLIQALTRQRITDPKSTTAPFSPTEAMSTKQTYGSWQSPGETLVYREVEDARALESATSPDVILIAVSATVSLEEQRKKLDALVDSAKRKFPNAQILVVRTKSESPVESVRTTHDEATTYQHELRGRQSASLAQDAQDVSVTRDRQQGIKELQTRLHVLATPPGERFRSEKGEPAPATTAAQKKAQQPVEYVRTTVAKLVTRYGSDSSKGQALDRKMSAANIAALLSVASSDDQGRVSATRDGIFAIANRPRYWIGKSPLWGYTKGAVEVTAAAVFACHYQIENPNNDAAIAQLNHVLQAAVYEMVRLRMSNHWWTRNKVKKADRIKAALERVKTKINTDKEAKVLREGDQNYRHKINRADQNRELGEWLLNFKGEAGEQESLREALRYKRVGFGKRTDTGSEARVSVTALSEPTLRK